MEPMHASKHLTVLMGWLKALYWSHWTAHWQVLGDYGDHLLLQRLYEGIADQIDTLAEKAVGGYGNAAVDMMLISQIEQKILSSCTDENLLAQALRLEKAFQQRLNTCYDHLKEGGRMPMGLDDFIMGIAGDHDTYIYLLQQRLHGRQAAFNSLERSWMGTSSFSPTRNAEDQSTEPDEQLATMWKFSPPVDGGGSCTQE